MPECLFCKIVEGKVPSQKVTETESVLLIPKRHVAESAADLGPEHAALLAELFALASRIARDERLERGWRLVTNVGDDAGQSVYHLHVHLLGGRPMGWPPG